MHETMVERMKCTTKDDSDTANASRMIKNETRDPTVVGVYEDAFSACLSAHSVTGNTAKELGYAQVGFWRPGEAGQMPRRAATKCCVDIIKSFVAAVGAELIGFTSDPEITPRKSIGRKVENLGVPFIQLPSEFCKVAAPSVMASRRNFHRQMSTAAALTAAALAQPEQVEHETTVVTPPTDEGDRAQQQRNLEQV